ADKVGEDEKKKIEEGIEKLRTAMNGDSLENIKLAKEELMAASHKLAEEMYKKASEAQQQGPQAGPQQPGEGEQGGEGKGETVDADFEVVDDDKKQS
ncbi:MAG: molecular chaperone DnaK, partial [Candidatus Zixiibacteriota bacterium]